MSQSQLQVSKPYKTSLNQNAIHNTPFPNHLVPLFQNKSAPNLFFMRTSLVLHEIEPVEGAHIHINGFSQRIVHTQKQKARKWSIAWIYSRFFSFPCID